MLTRYWITFAAPEETLTDHSLGLGVGVTGFDQADALKLVEAALGMERLPTVGSILPDVSFDDLERNHVQKNLGNMAVRGVWYPRYNL